MITDLFTEELTSIAGQVHALLMDPARRPAFAPAQLGEAVLAYPQAGGKALRPALVVWACRALGGNTAAALRAGAAVELYHTYTLVHDDIIDRDPVRRGRPSVHTLLEGIGREQFHLESDAAHYGLSMAILAGDGQQSWAFDLLSSLPELGADPAVTLRLIRRLAGVTGPAIMEGEARDIQLPYLPVAQVQWEDILRVIETKTAALFAYCAWAGGLLARGEEDAQVQALETFAQRAGIAFQLQDDVLGLTADAATLGKPVGNDLREGKRTVIITLGWARANEKERILLANVLGNPQATPEAIVSATGLLRRLGAIDDTQAMADDYRRQALAALDQLPQNATVDLLRELAARMVKRAK